MVAQIFTDITDAEIRVSWTSETTGYVSGYWFQVSDEEVVFPHSDDEQLAIARESLGI